MKLNLKRMGVQKLANFSIQDYIEVEKETGQKHEYHKGEIFAMAGGTLNHGLLCGNIYAELRTGTKGTKCKAINSEVKINIAAEGSFVYPGAMVICGDIQQSPVENNAVVNPIIIVEVLSKSSVGYDRGEKFFKYRQLPSLQEYVIIEQDVYAVDVYSRKKDLWKIDRYTGLQAEIELNSIGVKIKMAALYFDIEID